MLAPAQIWKKAKTNIWLRVAVVLLLIGFSFLLVPPYSEYCETHRNNNYECSPYEVYFAVLAFLKGYEPLITAIATGVIACFTITISKINKSQLRHGRKIERAYVSAGVVVQYIRIRSPSGEVHDGPPNWVNIALSNNGKTPAYVKEVAVSICRSEELPKASELESDYEKSTLLVDKWLAPGAKDEITNIGYDFKMVSGNIVYGRAYYSDIFGDGHSSGFILTMLSRAPTVHKADPAFTAWN